MDAILLVGGKGTRLRPLTVNTPKPMLPVAGVPFTAHQMAQARAAGVTRVVLATAYKPDVFADWLGDGSRQGLEVEYVTDVLSGHDIGRQLDLHAKNDADVTLYLTEVEDPRAFGCVPTDEEGRVTAFLEKTPQPVTNRINAGCYVFRRSVIDTIPYREVVSVERQTFPELLASGATVMGYVDTAYWLDLGTPQAFVQGSRDLVLGRVRSPAVPGPPGERLVLPGATVDPAADVRGGSVIGARAIVEEGAVVEGSVIQDGALIQAGAVIIESVVGVDAVVGPRTVLDGCVAGDGARIGADNELCRGSRIWVDVTLVDKAVRLSSDQS